MRSRLGFIGLLAALVAAPASAASLPEHEPLNITIVADEVNPHELSDAELSQPADLEAALTAADSGINIGSIVAVDSGCIDDALDAMPQTDVLVYFAHVAATDCGGGDAQPALTAATEGLLESGGGVVVFHHGLYQAPGKDAILELLGGEASSVAWSLDGRPVTSVSDEHFVTTHEIEYGEMLPFEDAELGVPAGEYPSFRDAPAESYPSTRLLLSGDEHFELLFVSDTGQSEILGYDLRRPSWSGHAVYVQPGEYQPNSLDDRQGNLFQILANAVYYVGTTQDEPDPPTTTSGGGETTGDGGGDGSSTGGGEGGGDSDSASASGGGGDSGDPMPGSSGADTDAAEADGGDGGGCRVGGGGSLLALLPLLAFVRRRVS